MTRFTLFLSVFIISNLQISRAVEAPPMNDMIQRTTMHVIRWKALPEALQNYFRKEDSSPYFLPYAQGFSTYIDKLPQDKKINPLTLITTLKGLVSSCPDFIFPSAKRHKNITGAISALWREIEDTSYGKSIHGAYKKNLADDEEENAFEIPTFFLHLLTLSFENLEGASSLTGFDIILNLFMPSAPLQVKGGFAKSAKERLSSFVEDRRTAASQITSTTWTSFEGKDQEGPQGTPPLPTTEAYDPDATNRVFSDEASDITPGRKRKTSPEIIRQPNQDPKASSSDKLLAKGSRVTDHAKSSCCTIL